LKIYFFQGILIWRLNNDLKSEEKYERLYNERVAAITIEGVSLLE
jgi:hypothetical protein